MAHGKDKPTLILRIDCMNQVLTRIGSLLENGENATEAVAILFNNGR